MHEEYRSCFLLVPPKGKSTEFPTSCFESFKPSSPRVDPRILLEGLPVYGGIDINISDSLSMFYRGELRHLLTRGVHAEIFLITNQRTISNSLQIRLMILSLAQVIWTDLQRFQNLFKLELINNGEVEFEFTSLPKIEQINMDLDDVQSQGVFFKIINLEDVDSDTSVSILVFDDSNALDKERILGIISKPLQHAQKKISHIIVGVIDSKKSIHSSVEQMKETIQEIDYRFSKQNRYKMNSVASHTPKVKDYFEVYSSIKKDPRSNRKNVFSMNEQGSNYLGGHPFARDFSPFALEEKENSILPIFDKSRNQSLFIRSGQELNRESSRLKNTNIKVLHDKLDKVVALLSKKEQNQPRNFISSIGERSKKNYIDSERKMNSDNSQTPKKTIEKDILCKSLMHSNKLYKSEFKKMKNEVKELFNDYLTRIKGNGKDSSSPQYKKRFLFNKPNDLKNNQFKRHELAVIVTNNRRASDSGGKKPNKSTLGIRIKESYQDKERPYFQKLSVSKRNPKILQEQGERESGKNHYKMKYFTLKSKVLKMTY